MRFKKYRLGALMLSCLVSSEAFAETKESSQSVEALMVNQKWTQASRAIFKEAIAADPKDSSIAVKQAQAGFLEEAITNAKLQFPVQKTPLFLKIAKLTPHISQAKKQELIQLAIESSSVDAGKTIYVPVI